MIFLQARRPITSERGDAVAVKLSGRRVGLSRFGFPLFSARRPQRGFTLIELVITITVLTILTMGVVPLLKLSVKRQKEQQLREALRQMRSAIDEFHRDTVAMNCSGITGLQGVQQQQRQVDYIDPRSKVAISDRTIFDTSNLDHYPPTLQILVEGVNVIKRHTKPNPQRNIKGGIVEREGADTVLPQSSFDLPGLAAARDDSSAKRRRTSSRTTLR